MSPFTGPGGSELRMWSTVAPPAVSTSAIAVPIAPFPKIVTLGHGFPLSLETA